MKKLGKCNNIIFRVISVMLLFFDFATGTLFADAAKPYRIELAKNWKLISSKDLQTEGSAISDASYKDNKWYTIRRMPATVLQILQEDGVYPDLYVGKNLLEKVP
jgi:exo-1,4-beta-D-glucosaminidase